MSWSVLFYSIAIFVIGFFLGASIGYEKCIDDVIDDLEDFNDDPDEGQICTNCNLEFVGRADMYITDKLLEELCEAVGGSTVELPSFGTIDISSPDRLKQVYWRAVETDENVYGGRLEVR